MNHVVVAAADFNRENVAGNLGGEGDFAARADGPVLGHEERSTTGYALDHTEQAAASGHLRVRGELDGTGHPGKFAGFGNDGFVGFEGEFEHRHGGADDLGLHEELLLREVLTREYTQQTVYLPR